ncbi:MAG: effector binding domain-containing protein [Oscillospiraceae bacterium]|nr:effector binding domain-containing protein [Oscillospiraceae bacterium]
MELQTISQVSKDYAISARMLRYYEQIGLIRSLRKDDYAYRVYDETAVSRLRQIIVLRKLRVPVKHIVSILSNNDAAQTVEIFRQNISQLDEEITALSTVKTILTRFVEELQEKTNIHLKLGMLGGEDVFSVVNSLSFSDNQIKESKENLTMENLNNASANLSKLADSDIRIVYLPPMTIAAAYASGEGCEGKALDMVNQFVKDSNLLTVKPDARSFGFDCSKGAAKMGESSHMYEVWVSIPDELDVPAPLVKRTFTGGMYAAHVLRNWDFSLWGLLKEWVATSEKYDNDWGAPRWASEETEFGQGFEETLNFYNFAQSGQMENLQLDLLFPIKVSEAAEKFKNISSPSERKIVSLPDENRGTVMQIANPNSWAVVFYEMGERYQGKNAAVSFSAEVKRVGAAGELNWTINNKDYTSVARIENAAENVWQPMSGTWTGVLTDEYPKLLLNTWENNSEKTVFYIDNVKIDITER